MYLFITAGQSCYGLTGHTGMDRTISDLICTCIHYDKVSKVPYYDV
jgi:hypothetical protein